MDCYDSAIKFSIIDFLAKNACENFRWNALELFWQHDTTKQVFIESQKSYLFNACLVQNSLNTHIHDFAWKVILQLKQYWKQILAYLWKYKSKNGLLMTCSVSQRINNVVIIGPPCILVICSLLFIVDNELTSFYSFQELICQIKIEWQAPLLLPRWPLSFHNYYMIVSHLQVTT